MFRLSKFQSIILFFVLISGSLLAQPKKVPGTVVRHIPAKTGLYIGSPSICILPNGDYVASHDHFGPESNEHECAISAVYKSSDKGKTWEKISEINGQFWSNLFFHNNALYIAGTWKHHGNFIVRRSVDGGKTWTSPDNDKTGLLLEGEYHTAPMPVIVHNGRIWRAIENAKSYTKRWGIRYSAMVISADVNADLLDASSWTASNYMPHDSIYLKGDFGGWLEGNAVVTPDGKVVDFLRVATNEPGTDMAAIVNISDDGKTASFDPKTGFMNFIGGSRKFSIRYDEKSGLYWTLSNFVKDEFNHIKSASVRNTLVIKSSPDLKNWTVHKILLEHPEVQKHGFQYVDWLFEGKNIIFLSRTAYDDEFGGANNFHDANYLTFHRIKNFRKLANKVLIKE